jgi:hypothetical protein
VSFTPSASGLRSAGVQLTDDAADSPQSIALSGSGTTSTIAFDKNLGTFAQNAGGATMKLTTTAAAAANTRVFAFVVWSGASQTLTSVSGGGLTWTVDSQFKDPANYHVAIASANAPSGLATKTAIQATFSASTSHGDLAAVSFSGIAAASPIDAAVTNGQSGVAGWNATLTTARL